MKEFKDSFGYIKHQIASLNYTWEDVLAEEKKYGKKQQQYYNAAKKKKLAKEIIDKVNEHEIRYKRILETTAKYEYDERELIVKLMLKNNVYTV